MQLQTSHGMTKSICNETENCHITPSRPNKDLIISKAQIQAKEISEHV